MQWLFSWNEGVCDIFTWYQVFGVVKQKFYPKEMSNSEENVKALR